MSINELVLWSSETQAAPIPSVFAQPFFQSVKMHFRVFVAQLGDIRLIPLVVEPMEHLIELFAKNESDDRKR